MSTNILPRVFHIVTKLVPHTFVYIAVWAHICTLYYSLDLRTQTYTEPVPLKYGKLATKYPWICGYFFTVYLDHHHHHHHHQQLQQPRTVENHRNACEAGCGGADESQTSGPSTPEPPAVHHDDADDVGRHLGHSGQKGVEVRIAVQRPGVERKSEVDQTNRKPRKVHYQRPQSHRRRSQQQ